MKDKLDTTAISTLSFAIAQNVVQTPHEIPQDMSEVLLKIVMPLLVGIVTPYIHQMLKWVVQKINNKD